MTPIDDDDSDFMSDEELERLLFENESPDSTASEQSITPPGLIAEPEPTVFVDIGEFFSQIVNRYMFNRRLDFAIFVNLMIQIRGYWKMIADVDHLTMWPTVVTMATTILT